jgi:predicted O-methyltransferase YrrM
MGLGLGLRGRYHRIRDNIRYALRNRLSHKADRERLDVVLWEPTNSWLCDRILLYGLVYGLRPERVLEIEVQWGGGAKIIATALEHSGGPGRAVGLEPAPQGFRVKPHELYGRYQIHVGYAPQDIPGAVAKLGGPVDLAYMDSMQTRDHLLADMRGLMPHMAPGGHILVHGAFHQGRVQAIKEAMAEFPELEDCGFLTRHIYVHESPVAYQGLRLLRMGPTDSEAMIRKVYRLEGLPEPEFTPEVWNWDFLWNKLKNRADANEFAGHRS